MPIAKHLWFTPYLARFLSICSVRDLFNCAWHSAHMYRVRLSQNEMKRERDEYRFWVDWKWATARAVEQIYITWREWLTVLNCFSNLPSGIKGKQMIDHINCVCMYVYCCSSRMLFSSDWQVKFVHIEYMFK